MFSQILNELFLDFKDVKTYISAYILMKTSFFTAAFRGENPIDKKWKCLWSLLSRNVANNPKIYYVLKNCHCYNYPKFRKNCRNIYSMITFFSKNSLIESVNFLKLKITHLELISLISRKNAPSRTWVGFPQLKLASLHAYKIWYLKWKVRME